MTPEQLLERVETNQKLVDHLRRLYRFSESEAEAFIEMDHELQESVEVPSQVRDA